MRKTLALCATLIICAAMLAPYSSTQTTKPGAWNGGRVTKATTFNTSVDFNGSVDFSDASVSGLSSGGVTSVAGRTGDVTLSASDIASGTLDAARIPSLDAAKIASGTLGSARLGSGTADSSTFLRGDGAWAAIPTWNGGSVTSNVSITQPTFGSLPGLKVTGDASGGSSGPPVQVIAGNISTYVMQLFAADGTTQVFGVQKTGEMRPASKTFATLPSATNGAMVYCSDCTKATPCASGGTGAFAKRLNSAWDCN